MKRTLLLTILGISAVSSEFSAHAQGRIRLDTYNTEGPYISDFFSLQPIPLSAGLTVGMYYAFGDVVAAANATLVTSIAIPGAGLGVATGLGSTAQLGADAPGLYVSPFDWVVPGSGSSSQPVTIVVVAYNGADYASSLYRGHSQAFLMNTAVGVNFAPITGSYMNSFVVVVPEPSSFALITVGLASLLAFRKCRTDARLNKRIL